MLKKEKKVGHKSCAAASPHNPSNNRPDLLFHEFPLDIFKNGQRKQGKYE